MGLNLRYANHDGRQFELRMPDGQSLALRDCGAVWWRRPQAFAPDPLIGDPSHASFAYSESVEAFTGLWQTLDAFWVNQPVRDEVAARKVFQLRAAQEVGLDIPETLVTNDPLAARGFIDERNGEPTVYKTFSATAQEWRETRLLRDEERPLLDSVQYAPLIFQEYIPGGFDVRITAVGDELFPAAIEAEATSYPVDFRMDMVNAPVRTVELPEGVEVGLRALLDRLGLVYGAIDMRCDADGRWVFLEVNPAGQWLFVEERTGQPMTAALAALLATRDAERL